MTEHCDLGLAETTVSGFEGLRCSSQPFAHTNALARGVIGRAK